MSFFSLALALVAFGGCTTTTTSHTVMLGPARSAVVSPERVRLYNEPPARRYHEIALVEGRSVAELRNKAAAVGANGLIYGGVVQKPGPVIGVGLGTSSYHFGRHSAYGFGTGASFDIPTGGSAIQAMAIYVP